MKMYFLHKMKIFHCHVGLLEIGFGGVFFFKIQCFLKSFLRNVTHLGFHRRGQLPVAQVNLSTWW